MERDSEEANLTQDEAQLNSGSDAIGLEAKVGRLEADLRERAAEVEALNDRLLRLHAEFENYKKRMAR